jgi:hypothetical protein
MKPRKTKKAPRFEYHTSEMEAKYKTLTNFRKKDGSPDWDAYREFQAKIAANDRMCPLFQGEYDPKMECVCQEFANRDKEGPCKAKAFTKLLRDPEAMAKFLDDTPKFEEDEAVAKKKAKNKEKNLEDQDEDPISEDGDEDGE